MTRILGIDYGKKRIGLALSDERGVFASPLKCVLAGTNPHKSALHILSAVDPHLPLKAIILGLPLLLNGKEGEMAHHARLLSLALQESQTAPVLLWDERLTSAQAEKLLSHMNRKKRAEHIDTMAASIILQSYLDSQSSIMPGGMTAPGTIPTEKKESSTAIEGIFVK